MNYDLGYDDRHTGCRSNSCFYFVGVAGVGMSPLAQFCAGKGNKVVGSDRAFVIGRANQDVIELSRCGVECVPQNGEYIPQDTTDVVVSAAVEESNPDIKEIRKRNLNLVQRSDLLAKLVAESEGGSVCVAGTAGKSTTTLLTYQLLREANRNGEKVRRPQLIAGAAHNSEKRAGQSGNVDYEGDGMLVFEGDESDKSVIKYHPSVSIITNIGHDHHEMSVTQGLFQTLANQTSGYIVVNSGDELVRQIKGKKVVSFALDSKDSKADFVVSDLKQTAAGLSFKINGVHFGFHSIGLHNALNVAAAVAVAVTEGVALESCSKILENYGGAYRRGNIISDRNADVVVIDDFAHTPEEVAETIRTATSFSNRVFAIYQPHGYGPLRKTYEEMVPLFKSVLRPQDTLLLSKVYYEGGTTDMSLDAEFVAKYFSIFGIPCRYIDDREVLPEALKSEVKKGDVIVVMGARDKSLAQYAEKFL
ncbi:MAG: Mur ligase domain-containing protein [Paludibacteraceae bacterium]|nr:Mur ligase domain-containing protein [Paludibacteraceae bacterium]